MNDLVPVRRVPRVAEPEVLHKDYVFGFPMREVRMMPDFDRESYGYQVHPIQCRHRRKGFTPRDGWWCKECGDSL